MTSASTIYHRQMAQYNMMLDSSNREFEAGNAEASEVIHRLCIVLLISAFDTYMHEQGARLLDRHQRTTPEARERVQQYLGLDESVLRGESANGYIRLGLSYKTLVAPASLNKIFRACGLDPDRIWRDLAVAKQSRPDHMQAQLQLQYDRRNQIAHNADWDSIETDFRHITRSHVADCYRSLDDIIDGLESIL